VLAVTLANACGTCPHAPLSARELSRLLLVISFQEDPGSLEEPGVTLRGHGEGTIKAE